jgi:hypothetical protein
VRRRETSEPAADHDEGRASSHGRRAALGREVRDGSRRFDIELAQARLAEPALEES